MADPIVVIPEPSPATNDEIGRLCMAWAVLEARTEATLWGILGADQRLGPVITWRLDLRGRWQMVLEHAPKKHTNDEVKELRSINSALIPVMRDRNIIVHGLVHALAIVDGPTAPAGYTFAQPPRFERIPCWTVFRGSEAGKSFPVSAGAVHIVRNNIDRIADRVVTFNNRNGYAQDFTWMSNPIESQQWPTPL